MQRSSIESAAAFAGLAAACSRLSLLLHSLQPLTPCHLLSPELSACVTCCTHGVDGEHGAVRTHTTRHAAALASRTRLISPPPPLLLLLTTRCTVCLPAVPADSLLSSDAPAAPPASSPVASSEPPLMGIQPISIKSHAAHSSDRASGAGRLSCLLLCLHSLHSHALPLPLACAGRL